MIVNSLTTTSAFYIDTDEFGIEFKKPSSSTWLKQVLAVNIPKNTTINNLNYMDVTDITLEEETEYQVRLYTINAEGKKTTGTFIFTTEGYLEQLGFFKRTTPCISSGQTLVTMYMDSTTQAGLSSLTTTAQSLGLFAYDNKYTFTEASTGWYMETPMRILYYEAGTGFTHYQECTPTPSITLYISIIIYDDSNLYTVYASTTETSSGDVNWLGVADLLNSSSSVIASLTGVNITIPNGQTSASTSGTHSISPSQFANTASTQGGTTSVSGRGINSANVQINISIGSAS